MHAYKAGVIQQGGLFVPFVKKLILLIIFSIAPALVFSQGDPNKEPKKDNEQMRLLRKLCADEVDAQNSIMSFSKNKFPNAMLEDEAIADRILLFVTSADHVWPTYDNLEDWFLMPLTESYRSNVASWMHIIRSKEPFLRKYRLDVIDELDLSEFPWMDSRFSSVMAKFNLLYEQADQAEKALLDPLFTHIILGEFVSREKYISVDLIEFSLFNKNTLVNLAEVFQERAMYHDGSFKYINKLFASSAEEYENYVFVIEGKELNVFQDVKIKNKLGLPVNLGQTQVSRQNVMELLNDYKLQNNLPMDSENIFTNDKILALINIGVNHDGLFTYEDNVLLFGIDGSGGLYNYLYQNLEWQNNYEDFFLLTILAAYQPQNLLGRDSYKAVLEGAKYLGILGTGIKKEPYKSDIKRKLEQSSLVNSKTSVYLINDLIMKSKIGYSVLRSTIPPKIR